MLFALNVAIFGLGFAAALATSHKSIYSQSDIVKLWRQLQFILERLKAGTSTDAITGIPPVLDGPRRISVDENNIKLWSRFEIEDQFDMSTWERLAYEDFKTTILAKGSGLKTFPCVYATMGYRSNEHRYLFLESDNLAEPRNLRLIAPAIKKYLQISKSLGPNTSLVIVGAPSPKQTSVVEYNNRFWEMLRGLRIKDPEPWPEDIPQDVYSEKWTFCFDGQPLFPVSLTPAHQRRWSRHAAVPLVAMQPKWVLDNLLGTPTKRLSATGKVRKLLAEYDQVDISPDLTSYGQPGTSEVHQLCLLDENETANCPYQDFDR